MVTLRSVSFFFFQAEDGIRDRNVTGVQTCALPISPSHSALRRDRDGVAPPSRPLRGRAPTLPSHQGSPRTPFEIGRASCREKSVDLGGRRIMYKKISNV